MTAGLRAWWGFMGNQKAPLRVHRTWRTLLALLWSGKQRDVCQEGLTGGRSSGTALVLYTCHETLVWVEAGVMLPAVLPVKHVLIWSSCSKVDIWELCNRCHKDKIPPSGFRKRNKEFYPPPLLCCVANAFVRAVTHLSELQMKLLT